MQGRDLEASAELVSDERIVARQLGEYVRAMPAAGRALRVRFLGGVPSSQDCDRIAGERLFVRIHLQSCYA